MESSSIYLELKRLHLAADWLLLFASSWVMVMQRAGVPDTTKTSRRGVAWRGWRGLAFLAPGRRNHRSAGRSLFPVSLLQCLLILCGRTITALCARLAITPKVIRATH